MEKQGVTYPPRSALSEKELKERDARIAAAGAPPPPPPPPGADDKKQDAEKEK